MREKHETIVERDEHGAEELSTAEQTAATAARRQLSSDETGQYELDGPTEPTVERDERGAEELSTAEQSAATAARRQLSSDETAQDETAQYKPNGPTEPGEGFAPLFEQEGLEEFRSRWAAIQTSFVDDPRKSVEQADELVSAVMKRLTEAFANERLNLEREWAEGEEASTEDLRIAFHRYRSFFDRLLSA